MKTRYFFSFCYLCNPIRKSSYFASAFAITLGNSSIFQKKLAHSQIKSQLSLLIPLMFYTCTRDKFRMKTDVEQKEILVQWKWYEASRHFFSWPTRGREWKVFQWKPMVWGRCRIFVEFMIVVLNFLRAKRFFETLFFLILIKIFQMSKREFIQFIIISFWKYKNASNYRLTL